MTAKSHLLSSLFFGMIPIVLNNVPLEYTPIYLVFLIIGSLWPDIDEPGSFIGRHTFIFSFILSLFIRHRGITHTFLIIVFYVIGFWVALLVLPNHLSIEEDEILFAAAGFILGNLFHIIGDMCTVEGGISLFFPFSTQRFFLLPALFRFKTNGVVEYLVVIPLFAGGVIWQASLLYVKLIPIL